MMSSLGLKNRKNSFCWLLFSSPSLHNFEKMALPSNDEKKQYNEEKKMRKKKQHEKNS